MEEENSDCCEIIEIFDRVAHMLVVIWTLVLHHRVDGESTVCHSPLYLPHFGGHFVRHIVGVVLVSRLIQVTLIVPDNVFWSMYVLCSSVPLGELVAIGAIGSGRRKKFWYKLCCMFMFAL